MEIGKTNKPITEEESGGKLEQIEAVSAAEGAAAEPAAGAESTKSENPETSRSNLTCINVSIESIYPDLKSQPQLRADTSFII